MNSFEDCRKKRRRSFEKAALFSSCYSTLFTEKISTLVFKGIPSSVCFKWIVLPVLLCYTLVSLCIPCFGFVRAALFYPGKLVYPVLLFCPGCSIIPWKACVSRASVLSMLLCCTLVNWCTPCFCFVRAALLYPGKLVYPVLLFCPCCSVIPW